MLSCVLCLEILSSPNLSCSDTVGSSAFSISNFVRRRKRCHLLSLLFLKISHGNLRWSYNSLLTDCPAKGTCFQADPCGQQSQSFHERIGTRRTTRNINIHW